MSRVGKKPVVIGEGVKVAVSQRTLSVEGPKGKKLSFEFRPEVSVALGEDGKSIVVTRNSDERLAKSLHGLTRAVIQNMIVGVTKGYEKKLEIVGVGYQASLQGKVLRLRVGFANEIKKQIPDGLEVVCPDATHVLIKGADKQLVGQFAAEVRAVRKPEPYKGKGIRYDGEHVKIKPGKAAT